MVSSFVPTTLLGPVRAAAMWAMLLTGLLSGAVGPRSLSGATPGRAVHQHLCGFDLRPSSSTMLDLCEPNENNENNEEVEQEAWQQDDFEITPSSSAGVSEPGTDRRLPTRRPRLLHSRGPPRTR